MSDLRSELMGVRDQYGSLTPANVLRAARATSSPLHSHFEWDDGAAAEKYRLSQARALIRIVKEPYVRPNGETDTVRFFHSVPEQTGERAYSPLDEIIQDPIASEVLLRKANREWRALYKRYAHLREFIDTVRGDVTVPSDPPAESNSA